MVIDFHTHIFPDALAARAIGGLEQSGNVKSVLSGRREDLLASMKRAGVDYSLNLPIASRPKQVESINSFAISVNGRDGLFSLGGIHPLYENYREELKRIRAAGLIGVKLHPDFQGLFIDSPWDDQQSAVSAVKDLPIDASLKDKILYENAAGLLKLE